MIYTLLRVLLLDFIHKLECSRKLIFLHLVSHWVVTLDTHVEIKIKKTKKTVKNHLDCPELQTRLYVHKGLQMILDIKMSC